MIGTPAIPDEITVHLGLPGDPSAPNVTVPFPDYIKNVASSEIFPTWPESALRANIYAQVSFALNRVFTEWYRAQGYDFDITNTTQYDQSFVQGRDYFENVSRLVDELFNDYLARPGAIEPLLARYCNGTTSTCDGLSQWGSAALAEQGQTPYEILTHYYGDDLNIITDAPVMAPVPSYPGVPLRLGSLGNDVAALQIRMNRISTNYPAIPKISPVDGRFTAETEDAVRTFQRVFGLTPDGVVGPATWYRIGYLYTSVKRLAELNSEGLTAQELPQQFPGSLQEGSTGTGVWQVQYYLNVISRYAPNVPAPPLNSVFGPETTDAVRAFQLLAGIQVDGIVGRETWNALERAYRDILRAVPEGSLQGGVPLFPGTALVPGSTGGSVGQVQEFLRLIRQTYPQIPQVAVTGTYDDATEAAVRAFQELFGIPISGTVGAQTWGAMASLYSDLATGSRTSMGQNPGYTLQEGGDQ